LWRVYDCLFCIFVATLHISHQQSDDSPYSSDRDYLTFVLKLNLGCPYLGTCAGGLFNYKDQETLKSTNRRSLLGPGEGGGSGGRRGQVETVGLLFLNLWT
jgi:hypothetical protein